MCTIIVEIFNDIIYGEIVRLFQSKASCRSSIANMIPFLKTKSGGISEDSGM